MQYKKESYRTTSVGEGRCRLLSTAINSHLCPALVGLVDENLRHPLDGDGEGDDGVIDGGDAAACGLAGTDVAAGVARGLLLARVGWDVVAAGAQGAENRITGLAKQKLLENTATSEIRVHR